MMRKLKGVLAFTAAMILTLLYCSFGEVKADEVKTVPDDVFCVVLPTLRARNDTTFNFIMDPQELITSTGAARYGGAEFEEGQTVYFQNTENGYSSRSNSLSIMNYSTMDVDVTITATLQGCEGLEMSGTKNFDPGAQNAMLYLALADANGQEAAIDASGNAVLTTTLKSADNAYEVVYGDNGYQYVMKENYEESTIDEYSFWLTGACNDGTGWEDLEQINPRITVVWTVTGCVETKSGQNGQAVEPGEGAAVTSGAAIDIE